MKRVYNFYAGPCTLPLEVMEEAQRDFLDYASTGMGVIEISHRSQEFKHIAEDSEALLRELLHIPDITVCCLNRAVAAVSLPLCH